MNRVVVAVAVALAGCSSVSVVRDGSPVRLDSGEPANECERDGWYEVVPAVAMAEAVSRGGYGAGYGQTAFALVREERGMAVYTAGSHSPEDLNDLLLQLDEPAVASRHLQRTSSIESRWDVADGLGWGGVVLAGAGTTGFTLAVIQDSSFKSPLAIAGLAAAGTGLIMTLAGEIVRPSISERTYAAVRRHLLMQEEDDVDAAAAAVDRRNAITRQRCGGGT